MGADQEIERVQGADPFLVARLYDYDTLTRFMNCPELTVVLSSTVSFSLETESPNNTGALSTVCVGV